MKKKAGRRGGGEVQTEHGVCVRKGISGCEVVSKHRGYATFRHNWAYQPSFGIVSAETWPFFSAQGAKVRVNDQPTSICGVCDTTIVKFEKKRAGWVKAVLSYCKCSA